MRPRFGELLPHLAAVDHLDDALAAIERFRAEVVAEDERSVAAAAQFLVSTTLTMYMARRCRERACTPEPVMLGVAGEGADQAGAPSPARVA